MSLEDGFIKIKTKIDGLANATKGLASLGLGMMGLGTAYKAVTGAVKQLYAAMEDLSRAYRQQRKAEIQLETAVKNNPYLDTASTRRLKEYAAQLQNISTVGDEQLLPFMAQLAATGRSETEIMQIMNAALNASASGMISLDEAVRGLNMSYSGQIGRLGMQIPALKNLTKEELEQGKAVEVVANTYKGLAEETAKATGSAEQLSNAWGDFKEEMGASVEETMGPIRRFFTGLIKGWTDSEKAAREYREAHMKAIKLINKDAGKVTDNELSILQRRRNDVLADIASGYKQGVELENLKTELIMLNRQITAIMEIREQKKEIADAEQAEADRAKKAENDRLAAEQKRSDFIASNKADMDKAVEQLKLEAKLKGEEADDADLLDIYTKAYVKLLTESEGMVDAESKEAKELLATIQEQVKVVQAKADAEERAAKAKELQLENEQKLAELRIFNQDKQEKAIASLEGKLDRITAPDQRTYQEQLEDEIKALTEEYEELVNLYGDSNEYIIDLQEKFGEKIGILRRLQHEDQLAQEKKFAEEQAAKRREIEKLNEDFERRSLQEFQNQLDRITAPDQRTYQEQLEDEIKALTEEYEELVNLYGDSNEYIIDLQEKFGEKIGILRRLQHEDQLAQEKKFAEEQAAKRREIEKLNEDFERRSLQEFQNQLDRITAPDQRTLQEQLADQRKALEDYYNDILAMETISEEEKEQIQEEYTQKRIALIQMEKEAEEKAIDELKAKRRELMMDSLNQLVNTVNTMGALAKENSEANLDVRIAEIEAEELSEEEKNKKILAARKKAAREQYRIELWQWTVSSLQAVANIAQGITECFKQNGPLGFITAALVSAAGAAQIATIIANKPQPPTFATGGVVPGNSYSGDRVHAMVNSGEMVLTRKQQAALFQMANGGPGAAGGTNINIKNYRANDVDVTASVTDRDIEIIIDKTVKKGLSSGRYDKELLMQQNSQNGTRISN